MYDPDKDHKICHSCQSEIPIQDNRCPYCNQPQLSSFEVKFARLVKGILPFKTPATRILLVTIIAYFFLISIEIISHPQFGIREALLNPPVEIIYRRGAHVRGNLVWWRLITANFVHFGIIHILFNAWALKTVTPYIERIYGAALTIAAFVLLGTGSMLFSNILGGQGIVAGASGALMGFIGMAAVAAHRENTVISLQIRNSMIKWAAFVVVFGLVVSYTGSMGVDNFAHISGAILGAILGFVLPKQSTTGFTKRWMIRGSRLLCMLMVGLCAVAFGMMGLSNVSENYQNECINSIKIQSFEKAEHACSMAYKTDKSRMISYHNYILIKIINGDSKEAGRLCQEGRERFSNQQEPISFDEMCKSVRVY